ncbi:putative linocin/CFP29 family protein [Peptoniphilus olsenii]|uniref:Type 1 encapsulin shell protein n=1 Tax=Peptoniphilus olsenii TaxID=411570 RepID=A0ABV2JAS7_9FIRM
MDILKRSLAPIPQEAWDEIDESARDVLKNVLMARKSLAINGPKGWDYPAVPEGRLDIIEDNKPSKDVSNICTGKYKVKSLVEARVSFNLDRWELDNVSRGAKDINLDNLEAACEKLAMFEDDVILNGYKNEITGLAEAAGHKYSFGKEINTILKNIGQGVEDLKYSYVEGPYDLIVSEKAYDLINVIIDGGYMLNIVKKLIGGSIIKSKACKGAVLIPHKEEDIEFTLGHDFSIGYEKEDPQTVGLFVSESFTLRILDEDKIVAYKL